MKTFSNLTLDFGRSYTILLYIPLKKIREHKITIPINKKKIKLFPKNAHQNENK